MNTTAGDVGIEFIDTSGQDVFGTDWRIAAFQSDGVILFSSVDNGMSQKAVLDRWLPGVLDCNSSASIVSIVNKSDVPVTRHVKRVAPSYIPEYTI